MGLNGNLYSILIVCFKNRKFNKIEVVIHSTLNSSNLWKAWDFPGGSDGKASAYNEGDLGSILGSGRSPGEGNHSSTLAWKIPWTEEPGRLQSMRSQRIGNNWATSLFTHWLAYCIFAVQILLLCIFALKLH